MWTIESPEWADKDYFGDRSPTEVLYEFDGPKLFVSNDRYGRKILWYACCETDDANVFTVVPTSETIVTDLKRGYFTIFDALNQSRIWIVKLNLDNTELVASYLINGLDEIPDYFLPKKHVLLLPTLKPDLRVRAIGPSINKEMITNSVAKKVLDVSEKAIKSLVAWIHDGENLPSSLGSKFNFHLSRIAFNSFEINCLLPDDMTAEDKLVVDRIKKYLEHGINWLSDREEDIFPGLAGIIEGDEVKRAILESLLALSPPTHGAIEKMEIEGKILGAKSRVYVFDRRNSKRIRKAINSMNTTDVAITAVGKILALDKEKFTFELRDIDYAQSDLPAANEGNEIRFGFNEDLYETVMDLFSEDIQVKVLGRKDSRKSLAIEILPIR